MRTMRETRNKFYNTSRIQVDYTSLRNSEAYRQYRFLTNGVRGFEPSQLLGRKQKLAFWINLYNTIVVDGILKLEVKRSVMTTW